MTESSPYSQIKIREFPSNMNLLLKVAICFDPIGSSSGRYYEPVYKKAAYILGFQ